jgi:type II secretory pathway component PulF
MIITYEAIDAEGKRKQDTIEASDVKEAVGQLRNKGLFVTGIREGQDGRMGASSSSASALDTPAANVRLPLKTLTLFTRQMAMLLQAGSGIVPALAAIKRQTTKPQQAALFAQVIHDLEEGSTLTDAMRKHPKAFSSTYCAVIAAGEASATLTQMFERLAGLVGKRKAMRNKILAAMAYPSLLVMMSISIFFVLLFFVLPRFGQMFEQLGAKVPFSTQLMLDASLLAGKYWWAVLGALGGFLALLIWLVRSPQGRQWLSNVQTRIPLIGRLMSKLIQGQVFRTMGLLLESRVGVLDTLDLTRGATSNDQFQSLFDDIEQAVTSGGQLASAFEESSLIEPYICQAVRTGEDSGNLGGAVTFCADILDETNTEVINALTKLIEPIILIGMGLVVGTVAIALFMPLFDLTSAVNG